MLAVADGGLGLWTALRGVYPETRHQRCWNQRSVSVADKLPKRFHAEARAAVGEIYEVPTQAECSRRRAAYCTKLRASGHGDAADCLERD